MKLPKFLDIGYYAASKEPERFLYPEEMACIANLHVASRQGGGHICVHQAVVALTFRVFRDACDGEWARDDAFRLEANAVAILAAFRFAYDRSAISASAVDILSAGGLLVDVVRLAHWLDADYFDDLVAQLYRQPFCEDFVELFDLAETLPHPGLLEQCYQAMYRGLRGLDLVGRAQMADLVARGPVNLQKAAMYAALSYSEGPFPPGLTMRAILQSRPQEFDATWLMTGTPEKIACESNESRPFTTTTTPIVSLRLKFVGAATPDGLISFRVDTVQPYSGLKYIVRILGVHDTERLVSGTCETAHSNTCFYISTGITRREFESFVYAVKPTPIIHNCACIVQAKLQFDPL